MGRKRWKGLAIVLTAAMAFGSVDLTTIPVFAEETVSENTVEAGNEAEVTAESEAGNETEAIAESELISGEEPGSETESVSEEISAGEAERTEEEQPVIETEGNSEEENRGTEANSETEANNRIEENSEVEENSEIEKNRETEVNNDLDSVGVSEEDGNEITVKTAEDLKNAVTQENNGKIILIDAAELDLDATLTIPEGVSVTIRGVADTACRLKASAVTTNSAVINIPAESTLNLENVVVDASQKGRVVYNAGILNVEKSSLENGLATKSLKEGLGIYNTGTVTLNSGATVRNNAVGMSSGATNVSFYGAGIYNTGTVTLNSGATVQNNTGNGTAKSSILGLGIYNTGTVMLKNGSVVQENTSNLRNANQGLGIYNKGTLTMEEGSAVKNNKYSVPSNAATSSSLSGIGIYNDSTASFELKGGSISGNGIESLTLSSAVLNVCGAGIYISSNSKFSMEAGSVTGNYVQGSLACEGSKGSVLGVGIYLYSYLGEDMTFLYGGTIEGNYCQDVTNGEISGMGVYASGTGSLKIGGNIQINGNGNDDNLYVATEGHKITVGKQMESGAHVDCSYVGESNASATNPYNLIVDGGNCLSGTDIQYFFYKGANDLNYEEQAELYYMQSGTAEDKSSVMQIVSLPAEGGTKVVSNEADLKKALLCASDTEDDITKIILKNNIEIRQPLRELQGRFAEITSDNNYSISIADNAKSMETMLTTDGYLKLDHVKLDAKGKARVISAETGAEIIGESVTITGGYLSKDLSQGAGLQIASGASATLENVSITGNKVSKGNNQATIKGIGVYNAGEFTMTGGSITANTVDDLTTEGKRGGVTGGALYNEGSSNVQGKFKIIGGTIAGNTVNGSGGAIYNASSASYDDNDKGNILQDVTIENNRAVCYYLRDESNYYMTYGGAIYTKAGTISLSGSTVIRNNQAFNGGGLYITGSSSSELGTIVMDDDKVSVADNKCLTETGYGAGVFLDCGKLTLNSGKISGNSIPDLSIESEWYQGLGGGIYVNGDKLDSSTDMTGGVPVIPATLELFGGEITGNTAVNGGSGIYVSNIAISYNSMSGEATPKYGAAIVQVQGSPVVKDNVNDDIRLGAMERIAADDESSTLYAQTLTITGALEENARLNVSKKICTDEDGQEDNVFVTAGSGYTITEDDMAALSIKPDGDGFYRCVNENGSISLTKVEEAISITLAGENDSYAYTGSSIEPEATVVVGEETLEAATDYTVTYKNNTAAGTATVVITGQGQYAGTLTKTFKITPKVLTDTSGSGGSSPLTMNTDKLVYNGKAQTPVITIKDGSYTLVAGKDYTVICVNNTATGSKTLTVTGIGNYAGTSFTKTFTIQQASLNNATVSGLKSAVYTGKAITQALTVTDTNRNTLKAGTDYTVNYNNNINAGTASVTITGKGNYTGGVTKTFTIAKANQTITGTNVKDMTKTYSTSGITIKASAKGAVTYSSSNTKVAKINTSGKITYVGAGTAKITIKAAATQNYNAASKTITLKVNRASQKITVKKTSRSYKVSSLKKKKATFTIGAKVKTGNGKLTYKVSKYPKGAKKYITVSRTGKVTMKKNAKKGTYKVTVTAAKTTKYNKATKTITIKVK